MFKIAKKTFFYSDWSRSGINQVRDFLKDDYSFLSYQEFKAKFKFTPCPLTYCGVISMLKIVKTSLGNNPTESMKHEPMTSKLEKDKKRKSTRIQGPCRKKRSLPAKSQEKWMSDCNCTEINWKAAYLLTH